MSSGNSYGDYEQDETSVLARSLALSTARLWEELFERLDRLERAHLELRTLVSRLGQALPEGYDDLQSALVDVARAAPGGLADPVRARPEPRRLSTGGRPALSRTRDGATTVPPVWSPAPLTPRRASRGVSPLAADVPPPPPGYVAFRKPRPLADDSAVRTRLEPAGAAAVTHASHASHVRVIGIPARPGESVGDASDVDHGDDGVPPSIAPDFLARAGRRRH
ncbi:MAG: hypothetical protein ACRDWE_11485 [Acidimicrobiales bacterium]